MSFDLARIKEGTGLGFSEDIPDCAFTASKIASLRDIERANPGFLADMKAAVYAQGPGILPDPETSVPVLQLASALLATDPTFLEDDQTCADYGSLRNLHSLLLVSRKKIRTADDVEVLTLHPAKFRTALRSRLLINHHHPQLLAHSDCTCGKTVDPRSGEMSARPEPDQQHAQPPRWVLGGDYAR